MAGAGPTNILGFGARQDPQYFQLTYVSVCLVPYYWYPFLLSGVTIDQGTLNPPIPPPGPPSDNALCYLEGTKILCFQDEEMKYVPIEEIREGDKVQTFEHGLISVVKNGYMVLKHDPENADKGNKLYQYSKEKYDDLTDDLAITGFHSLLVQRFTDKQREETKKMFGQIYMTDGLARLAACLDDRAEVYPIAGSYRVYHLALKNENIYKNYGIYANGVLSESTSLRMFEESGFTDCSSISTETNEFLAGQKIGKKMTNKSNPLLNEMTIENNTCEWI